MEQLVVQFIAGSKVLLGSTAAAATAGSGTNAAVIRVREVS